MVIYKNLSAAQVARKYDLPNTCMLINRINNYKKKLEKGAVTLASMEKPKTKDAILLKKRIKDLEKTIEKANILIYSWINHSKMTPLHHSKLTPRMN